VLLRQLSFIFV